MEKICFITAARSEYGLLKWLMKEVDATDDIKLQIVVTGGHLLKEQGYTVEQIIKDGFSIDAMVDAKLETTTQEGIAASMGRMAEGMAHVFAELKPDYIVVLGDRYELLPICNTAFVMDIPIIHFSGGDVTVGAIDDGVRNAVTMLATYHFPGTKNSAVNICRMRGSDKNIWFVGEPGLDAFYKEDLMSREDLATALGLDVDKKWVLMTYHAETRTTVRENMQTIKCIIQNLMEKDELSIVATYSNADYGGKGLNNYLEEKAISGKLIVIPSLGTRRYLSLMKQVSFVIGNSSSGIIEAPSLKKTVVNIGNRQKGRHLCNNIIQCTAEESSIAKAINKAMNYQYDNSDSNYWGDGHTAERVMWILREKILRRE